jgi:hypothetical protein
MIGCSMTTPPLVLSADSIFAATFVSLPLHFAQGKIRRGFPKCHFLYLFLVL